MTDSSKQTEQAAQTMSDANHLIESNLQAVNDILAKFANAHANLDFDPFNLQQAWSDWLSAISTDPEKILTANMQFFENAVMLYQKAALSFMGQKVEPVIAEQNGDKRFRHEEWNNNPLFEAMKQSYLLTSKWMRNVVTDVDHLDSKTAKKVEFFTERFIDAMSPTNFALTNPAVLEKIKETNGTNLVDGLRNMLHDLDQDTGELRIRMTDTTAFELGKNVAVTPGKVVFQNRMFQLIQYDPQTEQQFKRPLLIVPPWINKFYILDLQPKNSFLRWASEQGHTVFVVSWVNPDNSYRDVGWDNYVNEGVLTAIDKVLETTGEPDLNMIGYCIGGTLLTSTLAYMKTQGDTRVNSATFFTTMLDFSDPGDLGVFTDEGTIKELEGKMGKEGYLDGTSMSGTFNLMRANDLIWTFYINNYLLGNEPPAFDLLYWNSDSTRMPQLMHSQYLRNMYLENRLIQPGGVSINGVAIDPNQLDLPVCFVSALEDHIAPWKSTYQGTRVYKGKVKFILGNSGHIAGIVNPPAANKYGYRVTDNPPEDGDAWLAEAEVHEGSWWNEWQKWIKPKAGKKVAARVPGEGHLPAIEDAPGSYVKKRL